jgi:hypothetical protein
MCLNKPIRIPTGTNGASTYVAYAQDSSGTGFSYTPDETREYISFVTKTGTVTQANFTTWTQYIGTSGTNGTNGTEVSNVYVSDGVTAIGGTVYTVNTVIVLLSTGIYINAGEVSMVNTPLVWTDLTMLNGWASGTGTDTAKYSYYNGILYLRGTIDATLASSGTFASLNGVLSNTNGIRTSIASTEDPNVSRTLTLAVLTQNLTITTYGTKVFMLDSVPPIHNR